MNITDTITVTVSVMDRLLSTLEKPIASEGTSSPMTIPHIVQLAVVTAERVGG